MEPVQWSEKFSVGVRALDQQHQQLIKLLNLLIATQGTINTRSETISDTLMAMTRYAQAHFKAEESLMEAYDYPGLAGQKNSIAIFAKKPSASPRPLTMGLIRYRRPYWSTFQATECLQQTLAHLNRVFTRNTSPKQDGKQFGIGKRLCAG